MKLKYFDVSEFDCKHTGNNQMEERFLLMIDQLRERCGFPFKITSGYRDPSHPVEARKKKPGTHSKGIAADVFVANGNQAYILMKNAFEMGFTGIARGKTFVHLDIREGLPVNWPY